MNKTRTNITPSKWSLRLLKLMVRAEYLEEIEGDMQEVFEDELGQYSAWKCQWRFLWQVVKLVRPSLMHNRFNSQKLNYYGMFKHNLLMTFRGFKRHKLTFFINLIGLSTGLAASLLIFFWVQDEKSVDTFHEKNDQLHRVMTHFQLPENKATWNFTSGQMADNMVSDFPEVENAVRVGHHAHRPNGVISFGEDNFEVKGLFASPNFFDVLSYKWLMGNQHTALSNKESVALSESMAIKLFGTIEKALGQTVEWDNRFFSKPLMVSGVFQDPPTNSTQQFEAIVNYDLLTDKDSSADSWRSGYAYTFLQMKQGTNMDVFNEKIREYMNIDDRSSGQFTVFTVPYSYNYLHGEYQDGVLVGGRIENVRIFSAIAIFILLIACINFMNLSTAQASNKLKEIGVKKAIGARRRALIFQFLSESVVLASLALVTAVGLIALCLPQFNYITGKNLELSFSSSWEIILFIVFTTGLLAGSYPAFYLSGFKPVSVLKGKLTNLKGEEWIRKGLVVVQFTLSILFIIGVLVINRQIEFAQSANLGYNPTSIVKFERKGPDVNDPVPLLTELEKISGITMTAYMAGDFQSGTDSAGGYSWEDGEDDQNHLFKSPKFGYGIVETLGLEVVAGRSFSPEFNDDRSRVMINESAARLMKLENPVGTRLGYSPTQTREIIGVIKDFQYGSMHQEIEPMVIRFRDWGRNILVKIQPGTEAHTLEQMEEVYQQFHEKYDFEASFMTDDYNALYDSEDKVAELSNYMAGIAILVSCLGLFGLAAFTAERKTKEIGIRKVLGASRLAIMRILSSSFTSTILIAIVLAIPIGYFIADAWLQNFAYSIDLSWWIFAFAGIMAMIIALLTVSFQTLKAAKVNPVECLRHE